MSLSDERIREIEEEERARLAIRRRLATTPTEKKVEKGGRWLAAVAFVIIGLVFVGAYFSFRPGPTDPLEVYERLKEQGRAQLRSVSYNVGGSCSEADLTYNNKYGGTDQRSGQRLPTRIELGDMRLGFQAYMSSQCQDDSYQTIQVILVVGGKMAEMSESRGRFVIASASGRVE